VFIFADHARAEAPHTEQVPVLSMLVRRPLPSPLSHLRLQLHYQSRTTLSSLTETWRLLQMTALH
jgi:hypothetical protein